MKIRTLAVYFLPLLLAASHAQTPAPDKTPAPAATPAAKVDADRPCDDVVDPKTNLTGCQTMALENIILQTQPHMAALRQLNGQLVTLAKKLEASHPGMMYEAPSEAYPFGRLLTAAEVAARQPKKPAPAALPQVTNPYKKPEAPAAPKK